MAKGLLLAGGLSFLALLEHHADARLRRVGDFFASDARTGLAAAGAAGLFLYLDVARPGLDGNAAAMLEWTAVALLVLALAVMLHRRTPAHADELDWSVPLRGLQVGEGDLARATRAVEAFVDRGEREELVVMLVATLRANRVVDEEAARIIRKLVRYRPAEVPLALAWNYEDMRYDERRKRLRLVTDALKEAAKSTGRDAVVERR